jgi:hypothetical protein
LAIYRGAGGAGDATQDAASEVLLALAAKDAAIAAQAAAEAAQLAAETAQTAAELAETNAETAETNAETAETNAETAETNAETAATNAAASASSASTSASNASTSATNASNSASSASTSASNASTSATNAANSASSASTSATNAANSASSAATSATNAANSATAAQTAQTAAELAETNAETAETNAETAETNAAASASAAATSASNAASSASSASTSASNAASSASAASTSASNAATSETNAANSASSASTSATNASNSASSAASSASAAAASAANAAASYDQFDDRYLGSKTSDPTLDNDGNALVTGALYYNTVDGVMKVYDGGVWIAASAASQAILVVYQYTATASQTTFSGTDNNALTLGYTVGSILVTLNGAILENGSEYTATSGTSVVLASGATAGDELNVYAFSTFDLADVYTKAQADAKYLTISNPSYTGTLTGGTGVVNLGSGQFYKDGSGNVGIGTSSPSYRLDVSTTGATLFRFTNSNNSTGLIGYASGSGNSYIGDLTLANTSNSAINFNSTSSFVGIFTANAERMRIDSSGNVGIGTSSPNGLLSVYGTGRLATFRNATTGSGSSDGSYISLNGNDLQISNGESANMIFYTADTERMRLTSDGLLQFNSGYGSVATAYGCRAWVNFNGTGTVAIRASGNVSSITDNGSGDYTVNFTNALPDANYSIAGAAMYPSSVNSHFISYGDSNGASGTVPSTTAFRFRTLYTVTQVNAQDCQYVTIMVMR